MQLDTGGRLGELTYCTNIHAGEQWADVHASLAEKLPRIKAQVAPEQPLGLGLRISAAMAESLSTEAERDALKTLLGDDYYVFTVNAFPYGAFHGQPVKDGAYRPDWTDDERLRYTNQTADVLAGFVPRGAYASISTVPCSFKPWFATQQHAAVSADCATRIGRHAAHLHQIYERDGVHLTLAIEPEPFCLLETIAETVEFFEQHLCAGAGLAAFVAASGCDVGEASSLMRRYVGVCYDVCHAAVEYEDPRGSVAALQAAEIQICKAQLSSALRVAEVTPAAADALAQFDEPVYLHQTMERNGDEILRFEDLSAALSRVDAAAGREWRSHFHVPIFLERMQHFDTTQGFLKEILALQREAPFTRQLEVETYTWDVLPEQYRGVDVADAIARELNWVIGELVE